MSSNGAYSPDKAFAHPLHLKVLQHGGQPYPVHLHLILSDLCNLDCPGCAYRMSGYSSNQLFNVIGPDGKESHNPNRMLDTALVRSILEDCVAMGTRAVEFTGGGEPTVHPEAAKLIEYAQALALDTALISNGLLLRKRIPDHVIAELQWLRLSLDAASRTTYGMVRPGLGGPNGDNLHVALDAMQWAREVIERTGSECVIGAGFVVQKDNWREIVPAVALFRQYGAHNVRISGLFTPERDAYFHGWREEAEALEREAVAKFDDPKGGFRVYGRFHEKVEDVSAPPDYASCWYQHFTTYIGADANLYRCCVTSYNRHGLIGSVRGGFKALWDSVEKEQRFGNFDARSCTHCQFNDRNRAIDRALAQKGFPAAPADLVHPSFV